MWHVGKIKRDLYRCLVWKPEEKRLIGRSRSKLEENIKMDITEILWETRNGFFQPRTKTNCSHCEHGKGC